MSMQNPSQEGRGLKRGVPRLDRPVKFLFVPNVRIFLTQWHKNFDCKLRQTQNRSTRTPHCHTGKYIFQLYGIYRFLRVGNASVSRQVDSVLQPYRVYYSEKGFQPLNCLTSLDVSWKSAAGGKLTVLLTTYSKELPSRDITKSSYSDL